MFQYYHKIWYSLLWLAGLTAAHGVDLDGNGMCDVWQAAHHANALEADDDDDGDGFSNREESFAGTNPLDARSHFEAAIASVGGEFDLTVNTQPGKLYQLKHAPAPNGPWTAVGEPQLILAGEFTFDAPSSGERRFYRVQVTDTDTDNDGVSDWAELQLGGYDRTSPDTFSAEGGDLGGVHEWLSQLSGGGLSAVATSLSAVEQEETPAVISYTRGGNLTRPFTLFLKTSRPVNTARSSPSPDEWSFSDALNTPIVDRLIIPVGQATTELHVHGELDEHIEVPEHLRILIGGSPLDTSIAITDATKTPVNQRLLVAYLRPLPGISSLGSGVATIRLPGDNDTATVALSFSNLNSPVNSTQVLTENAAILQSVPPFNYGGQSWAIRASQNFLTDQAVLDALLSGSIQLGIYTENNVTGEISGFFQITSGSTEFQLPPPAQPIPPLAGDSLDRDIVRFLTQSTFGPTPQDVQLLRDLVTTHSGDRIAAYSAWIDAQFATASPSLEAYTRAANDQEIALYADPTQTPADKLDNNRDPNQNNRRRGWWLIARHAPDQLRQRMAFALSEIFVTSDGDSLIRNRAYGSANYYDMLKSSALGPYRSLIENVSLHPIMGQYLSHLQNQKTIFDMSGNAITSPDENYAREIMQLFSIGLVQLHPDGSLKLGQDGLPVATYSQDDIAALARVFTGWSYSKRHLTNTSPTIVDNTNFSQGNGSERFEASWTNPMKMFATFHDTGAKSWLGLELPAGQTGEQDLADVLDHLSDHPNTAPFICRRLIQRLVTANPSPGYLYRVASAFNSSDGDLKATVRAILLDSEARSTELADTVVGAGKVREPLLRYLAVLRAFDAKSTLLLDDLTPYGYLATELVKFPAAMTRVRVGDTNSSLSQTPQAAPSVFNWFTPDFSPSGSLSSNGLVSPEFQIANENSTFTATNYIYNLIYGSNGQGGDALINQTAAGSPYTIYSDNLIIPYSVTLDKLYLAIMDTNKDGIMTNLDVGAHNNPVAIRNACAAVLDHVDLMLCSGALKARYGETPGKPRAIILDAVVSVRSSSNSSNTSTTQATSMRDRIEDILWLVSSSPEFVVQK